MRHCLHADGGCRCDRDAPARGTKDTCAASCPAPRLGKAPISDAHDREQNRAGEGNRPVHICRIGARHNPLPRAIGAGSPRSLRIVIPRAPHEHATMPFLSTVKELTAKVRTNKDLRREAYSMSIYVSIILLSALSVFDDDHPPERGAVLLLELGTTVGLVLAHGFASWISTTVIGEASDEVDQWELLRVQLGGALAIASLAVLAVLVTPTSIELMAARSPSPPQSVRWSSSRAAPVTRRYGPPYTASWPSSPASPSPRSSPSSRTESRKSTPRKSAVRYSTARFWNRQSVRPWRVCLDGRRAAQQAHARAPAQGAQLFFRPYGRTALPYASWCRKREPGTARASSGDSRTPRCDGWRRGQREPF